MREYGIVQVLIQLGYCLIHRFPKEIDFRADGQGFAHLQLSFRGTFHTLNGVGRRLFYDLQIGDVHLRPEDPHLHRQIAAGIRHGTDGSGQVHAQYLYGFPEFKITRFICFFRLLDGHCAGRGCLFQLLAEPRTLFLHLGC